MLFRSIKLQLLCNRSHMLKCHVLKYLNYSFQIKNLLLLLNTACSNNDFKCRIVKIIHQPRCQAAYFYRKHPRLAFWMQSARNCHQITYILTSHFLSIFKWAYQNNQLRMSKNCVKKKKKKKKNLLKMHNRRNIFNLRKVDRNDCKNSVVI